MLTITIFAAGLVGLAGVLGLRLGRAQASRVQVSAATAGAARERATDERGITLQTLIVTAVLVLMAVAAGVVIVAITNNAAEDLEEQATNIESRCNEVEVYDPVLAARGDRGRNGGTNFVFGSDFGCIPVCQWNPGKTSVNDDVDSSELDFVRKSSDALDDAATVSDDVLRIFIDGDTVGSGNANGSNKAGLDVMFTDSAAKGVRVNAAQNDCILVDSKGDPLL